MARAIWLTLAFATMASGARYVDYSGVKMPEYGGGIDYEGPRDTQAAPGDEYRDHLQDAPVPLYDEEPGKTDKSLIKEIEDSEDWQKPIKKHRKPLRTLDNGNLDNLDKYSSDEVKPKFKSNYRFSKHRPRLKLQSSETDEMTRKPPVNVKYSRYRKDDISDIDSKDDFQINADELNEDKNIDFDDDELNFNSRSANRQTKSRAVRRKPRERERHTKAPFDSEPLEEEADEELLRRRINNEEVSSDDEVKQRHAQRRPPSFVGGEVDSDVRLRAHKKPNEYDHYSDYYDMKRVQGIKEKLPVLLHRTSTMTFPTVSHRRMNEEPRRRFMAPIPRDFSTESDVTKPKKKPTPITTTATTEADTTTTTTTSVLTTIPTTVTDEPSVQTDSPFAQTMGKLPEFPKAPIILGTPPPPPNQEPAPVIPSFEERSRLSILKKAQRKEMMKEDSVTKKPPVLLQVTNKMHTLVVVEPPTSQMPWQRAREVHDETPERLEKVKRLMRHKLVANAKSIHDLTENWDDMVCDYVDTSLLQEPSGTMSDSGASHDVNSFRAIAFYFCILPLPFLMVNI